MKDQPSPPGKIIFNGGPVVLLPSNMAFLPIGDGEIAMTRCVGDSFDKSQTGNQVISRYTVSSLFSGIAVALMILATGPDPKITGVAASLCDYTPVVLSASPFRSALKTDSKAQRCLQASETR